MQAQACEGEGLERGTEFFKIALTLESVVRQGIGYIIPYLTA